MAVTTTKAVSKRSARTFVDEGMEKESYDSHNRKITLELQNARRTVPEPLHNLRKTSKFDEAREDEVADSSSSSSASSSSGQSDLDISLAVSDRAELGISIADFNTANPSLHHDTTAYHSLPSFINTKFGNPQKSPSFSKEFDLQAMELSAGNYPANFGVVVPGVYRSSYPEPQNYDSLQGLGLKTIITLVQKDIPVGYTSFITSNNIRHHVFNMEGTKKAEIPIKTMKSILRLVLDQQTHPLLIHCNHGKHRTGCVVAVVRKLTGWELSTIVGEYKSYAEPKVRECDVKYITAFDLSTISNLFVKEPGWLSRNRNFTHTSLFTAVVLLLWLFSGTRIASQTTSS